jgi:hypothetical protein
MNEYIECCGYTVKKPIYDFFVANNLSVRAVCVACRLPCDTVEMLVFYLREIVENRLFVRNCGKRTTAEFAAVLANLQGV